MFTERYKSHHDASRNLKSRYTSGTAGADYLPAVLTGEAQSRRVIYLHVPFCNKVCSFCPFHRPDELNRREYHRYLIDAIRKVRDYPYMRAPIDAIIRRMSNCGRISALSRSSMLRGFHFTL